MNDKKNTAAKLVEIAEDIYTFGSVAEGRVRAGDPEPLVHVFASPKNNPDVKRPLPEIRSDLAAVFAETYGNVPSAGALGDAMTVLDGKARQADPTQGDPDLLAALLGGGKDTTATRLVAMAKEHFTFGVTLTGEPYAVPKVGPNVARVLRGGRRSLRSELARIYFEETQTAANSQALADALLVLEGEAQGVEATEVALRVGRSPVDGRLVLDLGGDDGRAVVIGAYGWEVVDVSPVLFWRTNATLPLPMPNELGNLNELRPLLNVSDTDWPVIVAWLVAALIADIPHPVLLLRGEHGTAKSSAARLLTSLVDRCASQLRTASRSVEDWCVAAAGSWVTCLDNTSDIQPWLQDAICRAVTGDGLLRRQLFTDSDVSVLAFRRVVALTSVDPGRLHGDLADRLLTVDLERIAKSARAAEEDLNAEWRKAHAGVLGGLLHVAVNVLRALPTIRRNDLPRMADFARVLLAVDQVLGTDGFTHYTEQTGRIAEQVVDGDPVAVAIRKTIKERWEGTASDLLDVLAVDKPPKDWPTTPQGMGGRLTRAAPSLRSLGWEIDKLLRTDKKGSRGWSINPPAKEEGPADSSATSATPDTGSDLRRCADDEADDPQTLTDWLPEIPSRSTDDLDAPADEWTDNTDPHITAGQDVTDDAGNLAGYLSECQSCGQVMTSSSGLCAFCDDGEAS